MVIEVHGSYHVDKLRALEAPYNLEISLTYPRESIFGLDCGTAGA